MVQDDILPGLWELSAAHRSQERGQVRTRRAAPAMESGEEAAGRGHCEGHWGWRAGSDDRTVEILVADLHKV